MYKRCITKAQQRTGVFFYEGLLQDPQIFFAKLVLLHSGHAAHGNILKASVCVCVFIALSGV